MNNSHFSSCSSQKDWSLFDTLSFLYIPYLIHWQSLSNLPSTLFRYSGVSPLSCIHCCHNPGQPTILFHLGDCRCFVISPSPWTCPYFPRELYTVISWPRLLLLSSWLALLLWPHGLGHALLCQGRCAWASLCLKCSPCIPTVISVAHFLTSFRSLFNHDLLIGNKQLSPNFPIPHPLFCLSLVLINIWHVNISCYCLSPIK